MIAKLNWTTILIILVVQLHLILPVACEKMRVETLFEREVKKQEQDYKIVCYLDTRSFDTVHWNIILFPESIDPSLCTHIIYASWKVINNNISFAIEFQYQKFVSFTNHSMFAHRVVALKKKNKDLKVLLSLGGWAYEPEQYKQMAADKRARELFINNTLETLSKFNMDGLDMYPDNLANRGDVIYRESLAYLVPLFQDLREAFTPFNYTLSAALPGDLSVVPGSAEVMVKMAESLNFITIIAYDLHGAWENVTAHASPLYTPSEAKDTSISVDGVVKQWLATGISKDKLILGLPSFGRSFVLKNANDKCPMTNSSILCPAPREHYSVASGVYSYLDVCEGIRKYKFRYKWLDIEKAPFVYVTEPDSPIAKWAGVEDIWSIDYKVKYLMDAGLGGATLFSLDKDDHRGICLQERFPILRTINHHLNRKQKVAFPELGDKLTYTEAALLKASYKTVYLDSLFAKFYSSENRSKEVDVFCECKKGLHSIKLIDTTNAVAYLVVNCDTSEITKPGQIDDSKLGENLFTIDYFSTRLEGNGSVRLGVQYLFGFFVSVFLLFTPVLLQF